MGLDFGTHYKQSGLGWTYLEDNFIHTVLTMTIWKMLQLKNEQLLSSNQIKSYQTQ